MGVRALLPDSHHYMTYDGSLTQPPCHETVTWILVNKPVYITKQQVSQAGREARKEAGREGFKHTGRQGCRQADRQKEEEEGDRKEEGQWCY